MCMMALLPSCTSKSPQDDLRAECAAANKSMPQDLGNTIIARSVTYTDGNVVYHLTYNELVCPLYSDEVMNQLTEKMNDAVKNSTDPNIIRLVDLCRKADADIIYEYNTTQGNTYRIVIDL